MRAVHYRFPNPRGEENGATLCADAAAEKSRQRAGDVEISFPVRLAASAAARSSLIHRVLFGALQDAQALTG